jgi:hypothetical protein
MICSAAGAEETMKSFIARQILTSLVYLALAPIPALAQNPIFVLQLGGPRTIVRVINNADRSILVDIDGRKSWIRPGGGEAGHTFAYGTMQNAAIIASACSTTPTMGFVNPPPRWASDPSVVGDAAIPANYQDPSVRALKKGLVILKTR